MFGFRKLLDLVVFFLLGDPFFMGAILLGGSHNIQILFVLLPCFLGAALFFFRQRSEGVKSPPAFCLLGVFFIAIDLVILLVFVCG